MVEQQTNNNDHDRGHATYRNRLPHRSHDYPHHNLISLYCRQHALNTWWDAPSPQQHQSNNSHSGNNKLNTLKNNTLLQRRLTREICANRGLVSRLEPRSWSDARHPHQGCVNTVQWNSTGTLLVSGGDDVQLHVWNYEKQRVILTIPTSHTGNIFCAKFLPESNDCRLVSCAADGIINVYDVNYSGQQSTTAATSSSSGSSSYTAVHRFNQHSESTHKLALEAHNPNLIISSSQDGTCRQFDLRQATSSSCSSVIVDWTQLESPDSSGSSGGGRTVAIHSVDISPVDSNYLIVGGGDYYIRMYDRRMNISGHTSHHSSSASSSCLKCVKSFAPQKVIDKNGQLREQNRFFMPTHITGVRYDASGSRIIGTFSGDSIYMFNVNDSGDSGAEDMGDNEVPVLNERHSGQVLVNRPVREFSGHRNTRTVKEVNFLGPNHEYVMSGSDDGNVFIWDCDTTEIVHCTRGDKHVVNCLDAHPVYPLMFASSGIDYDIKMWEPTSLEPQSVEMRKIEEIRERNERESENSQSTIILPSSFLLRLMNLMDTTRRTGEEDEDEDEDVYNNGGGGGDAGDEGSTTEQQQQQQQHEGSQANRALRQLLSQIEFISEEDEEEEEEEETGQRGTQCRTQ